MTTKEQILKRDFSEDFIEKLRNSIVMSHYKYGWMSDTYPELADAIKCLKQRLKMYEDSGNLENLVDVAGFAMIEFMHPKKKNAHFAGTDSDRSPGLVGTSYKQMLEEMGETYID